MLNFVKGGLVSLAAGIPLFLICLSISHSANTRPETATEKPERPSLSKALGKWQQKQYQESINELKAMEQPYGEAGFYQFYFKTFVEQNLNQVFANQPSLPKSCRQQLLFVTGNTQSLAQAERFKQKFNNDPRLASLSICTHELIWFDPETVQCTKNANKNNRLTCNLPLLAQQLKAQQFTHLVLFAENGKANVHNGIMYLDQQDTYDVFVHELAHFSGFVDEYALNADMAKHICQLDEAPNLQFIEPDQGSNLVPARTCDNHPNQAYKKSNRLTFMEYHDVAYIPSEYLAAWRQSLEKQNNPSAHVNFAQFYESQSNVIESQFWRAKYQTYLTQ
ncbi:hypothetical protein L0668_15120 [Paraglaciecola aquimarina]|uniref:Uncharacterized protein n=1 Tax=Paraglaciecola algarum TaxID=3050085 RepID=A0ABS9DCD4_9ALTE|nr:hypothetical protein [Paraglaciecola sp. G1-23]MCF2949449.1 hypothetical protein [Paraglaciecola sp. G1-23]